MNLMTAAKVLTTMQNHEQKMGIFNGYIPFQNA